MGCISIGKGSALALAAAASMTLAPITAEANGRGGWGGGWGGRGGWGHHDDIDAGDIFAGILIIGGIAAIASAASKASKDRTARDTGDSRDRDYRADQNYRDPAPRYGERQDDRPEWREGRGIDSAINGCVSEVGRSNNRVDTVDAVNRDGQGWKVDGRTAAGRSFSCSVDSDGRIRAVTVDGRAALAEQPADAG